MSVVVSCNCSQVQARESRAGLLCDLSPSKIPVVEALGSQTDLAEEVERRNVLDRCVTRHSSLSSLRLSES